MFSAYGVPPKFNEGRAREEWSLEELTTLQRLYPQHGADMPGIARTKVSIRHKASDLGIRAPDSLTGSEWTSEERKFLVNNYCEMSVEDMAEELGRSVNSVRDKLYSTPTPQEESCPSCGDSFKALGSHWAKSSCDYPEPFDRTQQMLIGLLLGDATLRRVEGGRNWSMTIYNSNHAFLEWVESQLGILATQAGVKVHRTAKQQSRHNVEVGLPGAKPGNASTSYKLDTVALPWFRDTFGAWYRMEGKAPPPDLDLGSTALKMWYCCDGGLHYQHTDSIRATAKISSRDYIGASHRLLSRAGFSPTKSGHHLRIGVRDTQRFLSTIGGPVPGMKYKWVYDDRERYQDLKP